MYVHFIPSTLRIRVDVHLLSLTKASPKSIKMILLPSTRTFEALNRDSVGNAINLLLTQKKPHRMNNRSIANHQVFIHGNQTRVQKLLQCKRLLYCTPPYKRVTVKEVGAFNVVELRPRLR